MRALPTAICLLLVIVGTSAFAQRAAPLKGLPTTSCGSYTEARINEVGTLGPNSVQFSAWVQGYLSAYNNYAKYPIIEVPEYAAIAKYLDRYCQDNPLHRVSNGIDALLAEQGGYKQPYLAR